MVDINEQIIIEKEILCKMLSDSSYELDSPEILRQSSKLDGLIALYIRASMDYIAASKTEED